MWRLLSFECLEMIGFISNVFNRLCVGSTRGVHLVFNIGCLVRILIDSNGSR
jgi:hypothetical protein